MHSNVTCHKTVTPTGDYLGPVVTRYESTSLVEGAETGLAYIVVGTPRSSVVTRVSGTNHMITTRDRRSTPTLVSTAPAMPGIGTSTPLSAGNTAYTGTGGVGAKLVVGDTIVKYCTVLESSGKSSEC